LILLELFVVTPIVLPHANCCGGGTVPQTWVGGNLQCMSEKAEPN
jgi:hypothetical protein